MENEVTVPLGLPRLNESPPQTADAADTRLQEGYECTDWYFCTKDLDS